MGGINNKEEYSFNWRINKGSTDKFQSLFGGKNHEIFHSKEYCNKIGSSMHKKNCPSFYKAFLSQDSECIIILKEEMKKFNDKVPEIYKKNGDMQLCPADIWTTIIYIREVIWGIDITFKWKDFDMYLFIMLNIKSTECTVGKYEEKQLLSDINKDKKYEVLSEYDEDLDDEIDDEKLENFNKKCLDLHYKIN